MGIVSVNAYIVFDVIFYDNWYNNKLEVVMDVNGIEMMVLGLVGVCFLGLVWMWGYKNGNYEWENIQLIRKWAYDIIFSPEEKDTSDSIKLKAIVKLLNLKGE